MKPIQYTYDQVKIAVDNSISIREFLTNIGLKVNNGNYRKAESITRFYGLELNKYDNQSEYASNQNRDRSKLSDEVFFCDGVLRSGPSIKRRLILDHGVEDKCCECGQLPWWNGKRLTLQVDHIDGNRFNNLISNLRILCPHCHTQTETYSNKRTKQEYKYCSCGLRISKRSAHCRDCANKLVGSRKDSCKYLPVLEMVRLVEELGYLQAGKRIGLSDNAVRKYLIKHLGDGNIPKGKYKK